MRVDLERVASNAAWPFVVGLAFSMAFGCGGNETPRPCDSTTCAEGCCESDGTCSIGPSDFACGRGGLACAVCAADAYCSAYSGSCEPRRARDGGSLVDGGTPSDAGAGRDAGGIPDGGAGHDAGSPADGGPGGVDGGGADGGGAAVRYSTGVWPTLQERCEPCHTSNSLGGLNFPSPAGAYAALVGVASQCGGSALPRVTPGQPDASLLYLSIAAAPGNCASPMPKSGPALIQSDPAAAERIRRWIADGALND